MMMINQHWVMFLHTVDIVLLGVLVPLGEVVFLKVNYGSYYQLGL